MNNSAGNLIAGAVATMNGGWRLIFWIQSGFHALTALGFVLFYWPSQAGRGNTTIARTLWACDPIGSALLMLGVTLALLGLSWAGGAYEWNSPEVVVPLTISLLFILGFGVYGKYNVLLPVLHLKP